MDEREMNLAVQETHEENKTAVVSDEGPNSIIKFSKPYPFEGKVYTEVDLSGLDLLTAEDMIAANKYLTRNSSVSATPELTAEYACFMASRATDMPVEFFRRLPLKDAIKIKNHVTNFLYGEE